MGAHSKFPPSSMGRVIACPASWSRSKGAPYKESPVMREGTLAHAVLENKLKGRAPSDYILPKWAKHKDITADMRAAVDVAYEFLTSLRADWPGEEGVEEKVTLAPWGLPDVWGTADYTIRRKYDRLVVFDYKHGAGVFVPADSAQLKTYGMGALTPETVDYYGEVELIVGQPRCAGGEPIRRHIIPTEELIAWFEGVLKPALADATSASPTVCPSEDACRWCPAKDMNKCPEYHLAAMEVAKTDFANLAAPQPIASPLVPTDPEALGRIYKQLPILKAWMNTITAAVAQATSDGKPTGLKFVEGRGSRSWADEEKVAEYLMQEHELADDDIYTAPKLISPAAAEKLITGGRRLLAPFVVSTPGKPILVDIEDRRQAITTAEADFKNLLEQ